MLNKVILIGRLGKSPEVRYTPDGTMVTTFSMVTDETWKNKNGEKVQKTEWHRIVCWDKLAEICGEWLHKGSLIYLEGKIETKEWEDKQGNKRYTTQIQGRGMKMLGGKKEESSPVDNSTHDDQLDDVPF